MTTTSDNSDSATEIPTTAVSPESSPTARLLEQRSLDIINCINTRTFETLYKYASSTFVDARPVGPGQTSNHNSADAVHFMKKMSSENPDYRVEALSTLIDFQEENKYATVWINILRTGVPPGTQMENVNRFRWRDTKDGWVCIKHSVLDAVPPMTGL